MVRSVGTPLPDRCAGGHDNAEFGWIGPTAKIARRCNVGCATHRAIVNLDRYSDSVPVPAFRSRMACSRCEIIGADVRRHWRERPAGESLTGQQWR